MTTDWLLRVGNGQNFIRSSKFNIWGINTLTGPFGKSFIKNVRNGDRMWFVTGDSNGKIIAVATYRSHNNRELGPLVNLTQSNAELGWTGANWTSDMEVHYTDLYNLTECELLTHIQGTSTIRKYNKNCRIELPVEYSSIVRYSKVAGEM
jgi:hypothetical protein